jgi:hypothetical protein
MYNYIEAGAFIQRTYCTDKMRFLFLMEAF